MIDEDELVYWTSLAHLPKWKTDRINHLLLEILFNKKMSLTEFFEMSDADLHQEFFMKKEEILDITEAKKKLPNTAFIVSELIDQGFNLIPIYSDEYPKTLKDNLELKYSPPLIYTKGDLKIFEQDKVAIVGSRNATEVGIRFTENVAEKCAGEQKVVVSGYAKGVDRTALETALNNNGLSIIVLPQGIQTFTSGFKKLYKPVVEGRLLVISTYPPRAGWSVGLAMGRNIYIYGLSDKIYVAESDSKGGTWNGVKDGLKKGRKIFIRKPDEGEKSANKKLIKIGGVPVDNLGQTIEGYKIDEESDNAKIKEATLLENWKNNKSDISQKSDIKSIEGLTDFFSRGDIQKKSGVERSSDYSKLFSFNKLEISDENSINNELLKLPPIEVDKVFKGRRDHCIVYYGNHLYGLNTENNCREALSMWFQSNGFETIYEFDDEYYYNIKNIALESDLKDKIVSKKNTRDLIAFKKEKGVRKFWFCEIKGHSMAESWDLFTGLKQLETLYKLKDNVSSIHRLEGKEPTEIKLAFVVPGQPNILHKGTSCYSKEIKKIKECVENPEKLDKLKNKKTYIDFVNLCEKRGLLKELDSKDPEVYLLMVYSVNDIIDPIKGKPVIL